MLPSTSMKWLTPAQNTRLESPDFYEMLQREVTRRFLHSAEKRQET